MKKKYKKYIIRILAVVLIIGLSIFFYYYSMWSDAKDKEDLMIERAYNTIPSLKSVDDIDYFTGEKEYYFLFGKSEKGIPMLVWLNEGKVIHYIYLFDWITKEEVKKIAIKNVPDSVLQRINAGIDKDNRLMYEVLYKDSEGRFGYQYIDLMTGETIKIYRLGKMR